MTQRVQRLSRAACRHEAVAQYSVAPVLRALQPKQERASTPMCTGRQDSLCCVAPRSFGPHTGDVESCEAPSLARRVPWVQQGAADPQPGLYKTHMCAPR